MQDGIRVHESTFDLEPAIFEIVSTSKSNSYIFASLNWPTIDPLVYPGAVVDERVLPELEDPIFFQTLDELIKLVLKHGRLRC